MIIVILIQLNIDFDYAHGHGIALVWYLIYTNIYKCNLLCGMFNVIQCI